MLSGQLLQLVDRRSRDLVAADTLVHSGVVHGQEEVHLALEVRVDGSLRDARLHRDLLQGGGVEPPSHEDIVRGADESLPRLGLPVFPGQSSPNSHTVGSQIPTVSECQVAATTGLCRSMTSAPLPLPERGGGSSGSPPRCTTARQTTNAWPTLCPGSSELSKLVLVWPLGPPPAFWPPRCSRRATAEPTTGRRSPRKRGWRSGEDGARSDRPPPGRSCSRAGSIPRTAGCTRRDPPPTAAGRSTRPAGRFPPCPTDRSSRGR